MAFHHGTETKRVTGGSVAVERLMVQLLALSAQHQ